MIGIYKITNPIGQVYIGQSINIEKRFYTYKSGNCFRQKKIFKSIILYGSKNHIFEIIKECEIYELNELERYYQEKFNVLSETGLNLCLTKTLKSKYMVSEITKRKLSISNYNRWKNPIFLEKISVKEKKEKKIYKKVDFKKKSKIILCLNTGVFYNSISELHGILGGCRKTLSKKVNGKLKQKNSNYILT